MDIWIRKTVRYDLVVCGGGLAGVSAALAAARNGLRVGLIHDRTVLGGNSSSEVRVTPHGAAQFHAYARETGIVGELLIEERRRNHAEIMENGWTNSVWDLVLLDAIRGESNIALHLNTKVIDVEVRDGRDGNNQKFAHPGEATKQPITVVALEALVLDAETRLFVYGDLFLDATGDGFVAAAAGCETMKGTEGRSLWKEPHAPEESSGATMGNSLHFKTVDTGLRSSFAPPPWAKRLRDPSFFYGSGRTPNDPRGGFWWIELGTPDDTIYDNPKLREELTAYVLGIWDWMKNGDPKMVKSTSNRALDWIGSVLGTRESRRVIGDTIVTEREVQALHRWPDEVAYGGWFLDLHTPGGLIAEHSEANSASNYDPFTKRAALGYVGPYGIPLSALIARDATNLYLAGRDISATHAALGTMRVMGTTALMGQAVGTAAAIAHGAASSTDEPVSARLSETNISELQRRLVRDDVWLPNTEPQDPEDKAKLASVTASGQFRYRGVEPGERGIAEARGMLHERIRPGFLTRVETRMAQLVATDGSLEKLRLWIENSAGEPRVAALSLSICDGIHDYTVTSDDRVIARTTMEIPDRIVGWTIWELDEESRRRVQEYAKDSGGPPYLRLELERDPDLVWHHARTCAPGLPAMYQVSEERMRRLHHGLSLAFGVEPAQAAYPPEHAIGTVARPSKATNLWLSGTETPAWLALDWETPQTISEVRLTFPGNILREYHAYGPGYVAPETAKRYDLQVQGSSRPGLAAGNWLTVCSVDNNYQRHRIHRLESCQNITSLRVLIHETNGAGSAGLYQVRVY